MSELFHTNTDTTDLEVHRKPFLIKSVSLALKVLPNIITYKIRIRYTKHRKTQKYKPTKVIYQLLWYIYSNKSKSNLWPDNNNDDNDTQDKTHFCNVKIKKITCKSLILTIFDTWQRTLQDVTETMSETFFLDQRPIRTPWTAGTLTILRNNFKDHFLNMTANHGFKALEKEP